MVYRSSSSDFARSSAMSTAGDGLKTENHPQNSYIARTRSHEETLRVMVNSVLRGSVTLKPMPVSMETFSV